VSEWAGALRAGTGSAGSGRRGWLSVALPRTLTARPVARTPDLISAAPDTTTIWLIK